MKMLPLVKVISKVDQKTIPNEVVWIFIIGGITPIRNSFLR